jgi:hypothetical protein
MKQNYLFLAVIIFGVLGPSPSALAGNFYTLFTDLGVHNAAVCDGPFLHPNALPLSSFNDFVLPLADEVAAEEEAAEEEAAKKRDPILSSILSFTGLYLLPISYFSVSLVLREVTFTSHPLANPLAHINPCISTTLLSTSLGIVVGMISGVILLGDDVFRLEEVFLMPLLIVLGGIVGLTVGLIVSAISYTTVLENSIWYYTGPSLTLIIPISAFISHLVKKYD